MIAFNVEIEQEDDGGLPRRLNYLVCWHMEKRKMPSSPEFKRWLSGLLLSALNTARPALNR